MQTIDNIYTNEIIIQKSKFICKIFPINNIHEIDKLLTNIKKEYKGANHYCYAYIVGNNQKYSDDKEPNGTAGIPILNVLKNKNLDNVLVVVIRYFGGIKLGAGGLLRAYTKAVVECLNISKFKEIATEIKLELNIKYENINQIYNLIDESSIHEKIYDDDIILKITIEETKYQDIKNKLEHICNEIKEK